MKRQRALLTGASGFTGSYVARELASAGYDVVGMSSSGPQTDITAFDVDLLNSISVRTAVERIQPDVVIHLAAVSFVAHDNAEDLYRVNIVGTRNLLDALARLQGAPSKVILASSANVYGNAAVEPINEATPPAPANDYAVSKLAMEQMARLWMDHLPIVIVRSFNYTGVGQSVRFLIPKIVDHFRRGAARIELGNIHVWREFSDVRAVAQIYTQLAKAAPNGETFNICSGHVYSLEQVLELMCEIAGYRIEVEVNPDFVRNHEVRRLVGDPAKLSAILGHYPVIPLRDTLQWMFEAREGTDYKSNIRSAGIAG